jgi:CheY-like chemotaxis protein/HPt (histidine-containing phosphotransfer) domain-containing protein
MSESRGTILLVETGLVSQRVGTALLEHLGFSVHLAADGVQAVSAAAAGEFDAILMSCQMPEMDGYAATAEIRRHEAHRVPIIAVTAGVTPGERERCLAAGMDACLTKPLSRATLTTALARWMPERAIVPRPAPQRPAATVLDPRIVAQLTDLGGAGGGNALGELATMFVDGAGPMVAVLRGALADDDAVTMGRAAHTFRGSSLMLGATTLARLCADLEADGTAERLVAVETELDSVCLALSALTSTRPGRSPMSAGASRRSHVP